MRGEEGVCLPGPLLWINFSNSSDGSPRSLLSAFGWAWARNFPEELCLPLLSWAVVVCTLVFHQTKAISFCSLRTLVLFVYRWHLSYFPGLSFSFVLFVCVISGRPFWLKMGSTVGGEMNVEKHRFWSRIGPGLICICHMQFFRSSLEPQFPCQTSVLSF